ncbi:MAG: SDR family NAD(P)-dependent oxidoreductase [Candidatus Odinarchaeota archaeon]
MSFEDRTVIVTGAGRGIGRATALQFALKGARVVVNDIDKNSAEAVRDEIISKNGTAAAIQADVSKTVEIQDLVDKALDLFKNIDILVNNAAIVRFSDVIDLDENTWNNVIDTNLKGVFLCSKAVLPVMISKKRGVIINLSSNSAVTAHPSGAAYAASKGGILSFTKSLAREVGKSGVRVVAVVPGWIATETNVPDKAGRQWLAENTSLGRVGLPDEIAKVISFLASDDASYITGQAILVDGGMV